MNSLKKIHRYHDRDDLDYHGIRNIENVFDNIDDDDDYKPTLVRSYFDETINIMKAELIKTKNYRQNNILT